jgi:hypothetical protein
MIALAALIATSLFWFTQGANTGWTKHSVSIAMIDPVTETEYTIEKPKYRPGIDFLGGSVVVVAALFGSSFLYRNPRMRSPIEPISIQEPTQEEPGNEETEIPDAEPDSNEPDREDEPGPKDPVA